MAWNDIKRELDSSIHDHAGEITFRAAARAVTQLATNFSYTRLSKENNSRDVLALFRGLLVARVVLDRPDESAVRSAVYSLAKMQLFNSSPSAISKAVIGSLNTSLPVSRNKKMESVRKSLQAASDMMENNKSGFLKEDVAKFHIDIWDTASADFENLERGIRLKPPLDANYIESPQWKRLEDHLVAFDESWEPWLLWLRFRLFGIVTEDIPPNAWPRIEQKIAARPNEFWNRDETSVNVDVANIIIETVDELLEEDIEKGQIEFGLTFYVNSEQKIDLQQNRFDSDELIKGSILAEVIRLDNELIKSSEGNSTARLHDTAKGYAAVFSDGHWKDDALLVMRGDALRNELLFQNNPDNDSDISPFPQSTLLILERTVRCHNVLVNSHSSLSKIDKMLSASGTPLSDLSINKLKDIVKTAEQELILTAKAKAALNIALDDSVTSTKPITNHKMIDATVGNMARAAISFLWRNKKSISITSLAASTYTIGHWVIANESLLLSYFAKNPIMSLALKRILGILHNLPLL
ncbi:hypothetical protein [Sphingomonas hylomeconis]|uniref:Uncharacterized protein n=1 Tax=Sphingomonas hylomeconis TaxID=1395958 RepID=A0ABV7SYJ0_9SPHN|nr:hypothetical protein [Sphingomonas hylomeconis]